jgi:hypothetical protein
LGGGAELALGYRGRRIDLNGSATNCAGIAQFNEKIDAFGTARGGAAINGMRVGSISVGETVSGWMLGIGTEYAIAEPRNRGCTRKF